MYLANVKLFFMIISSAQLREAILDKRIGRAEPYSVSSEAVEAYLHNVVLELQQRASLEISAIFNHYGSGYASYVDVFCEKAQGRSKVQQGNELYSHAIVVYLCRLAPVAIYGAGLKIKRPQSESYRHIRLEGLATTPEGDWATELEDIVTVLKKLGFTLLDKESLVQPLAFKAKIRTSFGTLPYTVFDALFHWED